MSINSVLNYSPFLRQPYAGTEEGLASNVFCENLSMLNGSGAALAADGVTAVTTTITIADGDYTSNAVTSSSVDPAGGTGMSAKFSFTATAGGGAGTYALTISIENPGIGYKAGDKVTFTEADIEAGLNAVTGAGTNDVSGDVVFVLVADGANDAFVVGYSADDNTTEGWQFELDSVAGVSQRIVISAPSRKAGSSSIANLERTTTVYANATSTDNASVPDTQLGGACSTAISRNGNTHLNITVVRFVPTGFTLNDCAMTVRLGDRQLATID